MGDKPLVRICYCPACGWLLRSAWLAQELLGTFGAELEAVALVPSDRGVFRVEVDGQLLWERKRDGGFPQAADLKRRLRDHSFPGRELGHSDGHV